MMRLPSDAETLRQFAIPAGSAQRLFGDDQPYRHDRTWGSADAQFANDAEQHIGFLAAQAGACNREVDGPASGIFGCFLHTRADPDKMNRRALRDDRPLEHTVFQESDARSHIHAALDAGAGDDPIADGGVRIAKEYRLLPASLPTAVLAKRFTI
jgi:hypothetical protein